MVPGAATLPPKVNQTDPMAGDPTRPLAIAAEASRLRDSAGFTPDFALAFPSRGSRRVVRNRDSEQGQGSAAGMAGADAVRSDNLAFNDQPNHSPRERRRRAAHGSVRPPPGRLLRGTGRTRHLGPGVVPWPEAPVMARASRGRHPARTQAEGALPARASRPRTPPGESFGRPGRSMCLRSGH